MNIYIAISFDSYGHFFGCQKAFFNYEEATQYCEENGLSLEEADMDKEALSKMLVELLENKDKGW